MRLAAKKRRFLAAATSRFCSARRPRGNCCRPRPRTSVPISSPKSVFSIETRLAADLGDYTKLTIRYIPLGEPARAMVITGGSGRVALDPAWYQASAGFIRLGIDHILSGTDHAEPFAKSA